VDLAQPPVGACIAGTGHYVPARELTNDELAKMVETSDAWITERTGIRSRRIVAAGETTSDMAAEAARRALESARLSATDIDLIVVATFTPDAPLPSTASYVQKKIGARRDCPAFDLAAACAGFCYALQVADLHVRGGAAKHVLVIGVESMSSVTDWKDRSTCVLFGDGAGAVVVSGGRGEGRILGTHLYSDGELAELLTIPAGGTALPTSDATRADGGHFLKMKGSEVFRVAVKSLVSSCQIALDAAGVRAADVDWVVPHQANHRILAGVADRLKIPMERVYVNLDRVGNTSSASIPIAFDEARRSGAIRPGQLVLFCAFGAGVAWASALVRV
jgi:3-oxoacyl-[acyl-carrier-protein] synthase-3